MRVVTIQANSLSHFGLAHQQAIVMAVILWTRYHKKSSPLSGSPSCLFVLVTD